MQREKRYDTGSVVPRFHGDEHRQQLALLLVVEKEDLQVYTLQITKPIRVVLDDAIKQLKTNNAPAFINSIRRESQLRTVLSKCSSLFKANKKA